MINRNCKLCGSRFTYAVPSRNRDKIVDDKIVRDADGNVVKIQCRRCRNCGQDYYVDPIAAPKLSPTAQDLINKVLELKAKKAQ